MKANEIERRQLNLEYESYNENVEVLTWRLFIDIEEYDELPTLHASLVGFDCNINALCTWHYEDCVATPIKVRELVSAVEIENAPLERRISNEDKSSDQVDEVGK